MNHPSTIQEQQQNLMNPSQQHLLTPFMFTEAPSTSTLGLVGGLAVIFLTACFIYPSNVLRWVERKRYQYEVTFSLYMMTPTEKFIFNSILFLFLSMMTIAASLYLPEHISFIFRRAFYYIAGGDLDYSSSASTAASHLGHAVAQKSPSNVLSAIASASSSVATATAAAVDTAREAVAASVLPEL